MRAPTTPDLLAAWERALHRPAGERALALLAAAEGPAGLEALTVGDRDARLLDLREWAFGAELTGAAACPECTSELEFPCELGALRMNPPAGAEPEGEIEADGCAVRFRLPRAGDLVAAAARGSAGAARAELRDRCVVSAERDGLPVAAAELPPAALERLQDELCARDPQADLQLALACPDCGHRWSALFDIATFLWTEVDQWARRVLVDVATLAGAFGWTEAEVLGLGPARREAYLELAAR